jgi:hypothetical protein
MASQTTGCNALGWSPCSQFQQVLSGYVAVAGKTFREFVPEQAYWWCREAAKQFRFLLSPYDPII